MKVLPFDFPFSAVSGQQNYKLALILAAINPGIGGVLVSGFRGSAKSTLARGFAQLLGDTHPFVTLPLSTTEEMLIGTLDLQKVLNDKNVSFNPGILAKANNGVLYVDEVNLLPDFLVDLLLDVAASGINYVERDGISHSHESRFLLLGTMNPDEGEIRPQLLDRFGLSVQLNNQYTIQQRIEIVRLRESFEKDPEEFIKQFDVQQKQLKQKITHAKQLINKVNCNAHIRELIARRCSKANVDGVRADIVWYRAASAHAAWSQSNEISEQDVYAVEELVLAHRRKNSLPPKPNQDEQKNSESQHSNSPQSFFKRPESSYSDTFNSKESIPSSNEKTEKNTSKISDWGTMLPQKSTEIIPAFMEEWPLLDKHKSTNVKSLLQTGLASNKSQKGVLGGGYLTQNLSCQPAWFNTIISGNGSWPPKKIQFKKSKNSLPILNLILLDTSASVLKQQQFAKAKSVVQSIVEKAYINREQLCVFGFGNQNVQTLLAKQKAPKVILEWLKNITAGGGTPLNQMINQVYDYQIKCLRALPQLLIKNYLITDGGIAQTIDNLKFLGQSVLIDIESSIVKRGKGRIIAKQLGADYLTLPTGY
ncbi:AAA family ATPase [Aliikangiella sp. IMCC44359]|uniref:AAA family ATPase n=1 Tax=Aliikangiella sp. IMCC44359 TaxID=3459125 RepID=UPI00403AA7E2